MGNRPAAPAQSTLESGEASEASSFRCLYYGPVIPIPRSSGKTAGKRPEQDLDTETSQTKKR